MKSQIYLFAILVSFAFLGINGCKEKVLDTPPYYIPEADTSGGRVITIEQFKNLAPGLASGTVYKVDTNVFIKGVISGNDEGGNIYKKLFIQDTTGGLLLSLDAKTMYLKYPLGQTVYVKCKGSYIGNSYGILQFGGIYNGGPGRLATDQLDTVVLLDGLPDKNLIPEPKSMKIQELTTSHLNLLIKLDSLTFEEAGTNVYASAADGNYPERTVTDMNGYKIVLSNSSYADFAKDTLPEGKVNLTGIVGYFSSGTPPFRLILRDKNDIEF